MLCLVHFLENRIDARCTMYPICCTLMYIDVHRRGTGVHMRERQVGEGEERGKEGEGQKYRQNSNKFKSFS